jgi:hypothetical protein
MYQTKTMISAWLLRHSKQLKNLIFGLLVCTAVFGLGATTSLSTYAAN